MFWVVETIDYLHIFKTKEEASHHSEALETLGIKHKMYKQPVNILYKNEKFIVE